MTLPAAHTSTSLEAHKAQQVQQEQMEALCPGCGGAFACGVKRVPFACDCQSLCLTLDEIASLCERFGNQCVCRACLQRAQAEREAL